MKGLTYAQFIEGNADLANMLTEDEYKVAMKAREEWEKDNNKQFDENTQKIVGKYLEAEKIYKEMQANDTTISLSQIAEAAKAGSKFAQLLTKVVQEKAKDGSLIISTKSFTDPFHIAAVEEILG